MDTSSGTETNGRNKPVELIKQLETNINMVSVVTVISSVILIGIIYTSRTRT